MAILSGMDQNRIVDFLKVAIGYSASASAPYQGTLATNFSASSAQLGHIRLITTVTPSNSTTNGSELSGNGYVPGTGINFTTGTAGTFSTPAYSGGQAATQNNASLQQTSMPAATVGGIEIWDSAGTSPAYVASLRWWWGQLTVPVTTNANDTLLFNASAIQAAIISP